jgi:hypothetical protein
MSVTRRQILAGAAATAACAGIPAAAAIGPVQEAPRYQGTTIYADAGLPPVTLGIDRDLYCDTTTDFWWLKRWGKWTFFVDHSVTGEVMVIAGKLPAPRS